MLVVIAIIGVLISMLLPAVQSARETGRRTQCKNHLHQLATAALTHESVKAHLPTGGVNAAMMDGSVQSFEETVALEFWPALATRAGREVLPSN